MFKILITDPISEHGLKILEDDRIELIYKPDLSNKELENILPDIDGWIIRSGTKVSKKNIAMIFYTSGSTGMPKGVKMSNENFVSSLNDHQ